MEVAYTRLFRYSAYLPEFDERTYSDILMTLEEAYYYYLDNGVSKFAVVDAYSLEYGGTLDMENLNELEQYDIYQAIKG